MTSQAEQKKTWVTQRVRDALASGSNTELLKALVEAFPGSWFFTRADGTFAFVNQTACDSLGYTREELMGLTIFELCPTMTQEAWNALLALGPFTPAAVRTTHRRKDGRLVPVEAYGSRIILGDENVAVSYVVDLSEEAQARQDLADKQLLLQTLLDSAPVAVWFVEPTGRIELSEGNGASLFAPLANPVVGRAVSDVFNGLPEMIAATERALGGAMAFGIVPLGKREFEYRYQPRWGADGAVIGATGVAIDVTDRRGFERANQRLTTAIEQAEEWVVLLDREGCVEFANAAFEASALAPGVERRGRLWLDLLPDAPAARLTRTELGRAMAEGASWRGTIRTRPGNEQERSYQASLSPIREAKGELSGFVVVGRDVTEQTRAEQRLRQIEKMDAVGQLAGGIAHDFNNLLQIILGNAQLCLKASSPEPARELLSEITDAGMRAASLVSQLLAFSRNVGEPRVVSLSGLVQRILPLLNRLLGAHIVIEVDVEGRDLNVWGEESQLEQIVVNLCVNARDAMPEGGRLGLVLSCRLVGADEAARIGLAGPGRYVVLEVVDTGCGMTAEVARRSFEPFFTTKPPGTGTGLGLATVFAVAKRHGGAVELESQVGRGTRFRVMLRHAEDSIAPAPPGALRRETTAFGLGVLLVENEPAVRDVIHRFLEQSGHRVTTSPDGEDAIAILRGGIAQFDLLVVDAIMPRVSGPEVYRRFRAISRAPVLFVSGHEFNALESLPFDPARALLRKPFSAEDLASAIHQLVSGASIGRQ